MLFHIDVHTAIGTSLFVDIITPIVVIIITQGKCRTQVRFMDRGFFYYKGPRLVFYVLTIQKERYFLFCLVSYYYLQDLVAYIRLKKRLNHGKK